MKGRKEVATTTTTMKRMTTLQNVHEEMVTRSALRGFLMSPYILLLRVQCEEVHPHLTPLHMDT